MDKIEIVRDITIEWKDGQYLFEGRPMDLLEQSFTAFYLLRQHKPETVREWLCREMVFLEDSKNSKDSKGNYFLSVCWVWILGEYLNLCPNDRSIETFEPAIQKAVATIAEQWRSPRENWFYSKQAGIYTTNIAWAFGALQSLNNRLDRDDISRIQLEMKNYLFQNLLFKGRVLSSLGNEAVFGDLSLMSVPFGFMDAGNQILKASMALIENDLVDQGVRFAEGDSYYGGCSVTELTNLMAWYYSERGDLDRAKALLSQAEDLWNHKGFLPSLDSSTAKVEELLHYWEEKNNGPLESSYLSVILFALAQWSIHQKQKQTGESTGQSLITISHQPTGTGDPYRTERNERFPRHPSCDEAVCLNVQTQPCRPDQNLQVVCTVNGRTRPAVSLRLEETAVGERYWQCSIGRFDAFDFVEYEFIAMDGPRPCHSVKYSFDVRQWIPMNPSGSEDESGKTCLVYSNPEYPDWSVSLSMNKISDNQWKASYAFVKKNSDSFISPDSGEKQVQGELSCKDRTLPDYFDQQNGEPSDRFSTQALPFLPYVDHQEPFIELLADSETIHAIRIRTALSPDEQFFGMGERYYSIVFRGDEVSQYVYNQYRDQDRKTYIPVPLLLSSNHYGIYLDTTNTSIFRFGTHLADQLEIETAITQMDKPLDTYIFLGSPADVLKSYAQTFGNPILPPKWAFGPWMSSNNWDRQSETLRQLRLTQEHRIPSTALVLEQWSDEATFYIFNDARYKVKENGDALEYSDFDFPEWGRWPDPKKMVEEIHAAGLKLILWQMPAMKYMDGIAHAQRDADEKSMLRQNYHVRRNNGEPYHVPSYEWFKGSTIPDYTNEKAREWWLSKRRYLVETLGIDGFKTDGGECVYGEDTVFSNKKTGLEMRNQYPLDYIKSFYDLVLRYKKDGVAFSRAGYAGIQKCSLVWAGDERSTWPAFRASIRAGLSAGLSGIPFWGWDLAGFHADIPTAELYIRSAQMAAFCPIMQYHNETKGQFNQERTPWNIAERTGEPRVIEIYRKFADMRMNLLPYIYHQALISSRTGLPMMRAMFLSYPEDRSGSEQDDQYLFGDSFLVAPMVREQESTRFVYLPEGRWLDFFTQKSLPGNQRLRCCADWDTFPVFVRENSVIPMNLDASLQPGLPVGNGLKCYNHLCFLVFACSDLEYQFTDDLGNQIDFSIVMKEDQIRISVQSAISLPIHLILPEMDMALRVLCDDAPLGGCGPVGAAADGICDCYEADGACDCYGIENGRLVIHLLAGERKTVTIWKEPHPFLHLERAE